MAAFTVGCNSWPCDDRSKYRYSRIDLLERLGETELSRFETLPATVAFGFDSRPDEENVADMYQRAFAIGADVWPDAVDVPFLNVVDDSAAADIVVSVEVDPDPSRRDDCENQCGVNVECTEGQATTIRNGFNLIRPPARVQIYRNAFEECQIRGGKDPEEVAHKIALVVAHELGHATGFGGHSPIIGDLMYTESPASVDLELVNSLRETSQDVEFDLFSPETWLSRGDRDTMRALYCM